MMETRKDKKRIYWDSCVFIRLLSKTKDPPKVAEQEICTKFLQSAIEGNIDIITSTVTIAEVVKTEELIQTPIPQSIRDKISALFNEPCIILVSADLVIAKDARDKIWTYSWLDAIDSIHISSAIYSKVNEMFSYDGLGVKKGILDLDGKVGSPPLKIKKPHFEGQQPLITVT